MIKLFLRPKRITMENGDYTASDYLPDGTLLNRTFSSKRIETVTSVNASGDTVRREVTRSTTNTNTYLGSFWTLSGSQKARRVLTPTGYVDLTTGHRYWYITNRQGSTTAVVDEAGKVVQRNGYYPSGTPFVLPTEAMWTKPQAIDEVTDQLHIGNRWMGHSGLNLYDNTARMHDPILMRYASPDPLFGKYPDTSPWSHCSANPLNAVDLFGEDEYVFNDNGEMIEQIANPDNDIIRMQSSGRYLMFKPGTIIKHFSVANSKKIIADHCALPDNKYDDLNSDPNKPTIDYLQVRGDDNAIEIFEFLADELNDREIEFSLIMTGQKDSKGLSFIGTSHLMRCDNSSKIIYDGMLKHGYTIRYWLHNHPAKPYPSQRDQMFINGIEKSQSIKWAIYHSKTSLYRKYDSSSIGAYYVNLKDL